MTGYEPHFDRDLKRGEVGENTHNAFLIGKHEVKTDYRTKETGNCYVELSQYNERGEWDSGLVTTHADWWVLAGPSGSGSVYIKTEILKDLIRRNWEVYRKTKQPEHNQNTNASTGVLVPFKDILKELDLMV
jgi:hypothetical protein